MEPHDYHALVAAPAYREASGRVLGQLVEALVFEGALAAQWDDGTLSIAAQAADGAGVRYHAPARRCFGFERMRLSAPLRRSHAGGDAQASDPALFLAEVGPALGADATRLQAFAAELLATQIKHAQTLHTRAGDVLRDADYDRIEARMTQAHPYHPSFKSRLGFTLCDNAGYAPELAQTLAPVLLAVRRDASRWAASPTLPDAALAASLLEPEDADRYARALAERGLRPADYLPLPVHPWQWHEAVAPLCHPALARQELIAIGPMAARYRPQQSIRTLANAQTPQAWSLKLAMNLVNTSTARVLAPHTVVNAPAISDWLQALVEATAWDAPLAAPLLLREAAGVGYTPAHSAAGQYGALACIWRESPHGRLRDGQALVPMSALARIEGDGRPFIDPWIARHGAEAWLVRLVERAFLPVLHLLWRHGVALESHAQNMGLVHEAGLPARVLLKDFHDGVRYGRRWLSSPPPALTAPPAAHAQVNPNSFLETDSADELRDFTFDALFFVNLAELAAVFDQYYDVPETRFWALVAQALRRHQARYPELAEAFARFDCFAPTVDIELLASRRFLPEVRLRTRATANPLAQAEARACS